MSTHMDARTLERAWDAQVLGEPTSIFIDDHEERRLLELLAGADRPVPNPNFVRALERQLALDSSPQVPSPVPASTQSHSRPTTKPVRRQWTRPFAGPMPSVMAIAAITLLLILSAAAIAVRQSGPEIERSIPAVSQWIEAGPPTSPGVDTTPIFSHAFTAEDLANFSMDQWGWVELVRGTVAPGARSFEDPTRVQSSEIPGISVISVYSGQLNARLVKAAVVYRQNVETIAEPAEISVGAGDTLVFGAGTLAELWNPTDVEAAYIAGGLYTKSADPILFTDDRTSTLPQGISFQASMFAGSSSLELSTDRIAIEPGQAFAYSITPRTLLLASIVGDGLEKQEWSNGERQGSARTLVPSAYSFHQDGPGYYTLTNTGSEPVEIQFFSVRQVESSQSSPPPAAHVETFFNRTLNQDELARYRSEDWQWIGFTRGTIAPGQQSVIVEGSPVGYDPDYAGIGTVTVEEGMLEASVDSGAWVQRSGSDEIETIEQRTTVTLDAGDTLFVPPSSLPAMWNPGETDAIYVAGGVYTSGSIYPLDTSANSVQGGIQVNPNDLAIGEPLTFTLDHVVIGPGEIYPFAISSETWLLAMVTGEGLEKQKRLDGVAQADAQALAPDIYRLHRDGFGDYELTNVGFDPVEVYFYRVEPVPKLMPQAALTPQVETLVDVSLSLEQLEEYRFDEWRWIQLNRNEVAPQGDSTLFPQLMLPGWNVVPGMNLMSVESGVLIVAPESDVLVARGSSGTFEHEPGGSEITLSAGDSLLYASGTEGPFWNPTGTKTMVIGGGGYLRPETPAFGGPTAVLGPPGQFGHGLTITPGDMPDDIPMSVAIERVSINPDGSTTVDLGSGRWVLVAVERGDLLQTTYLHEVQSGEPVSVVQGEIKLQPEHGKSVELRNVGTSVAVIYLLRFEPIFSDNVA